MSASTEVWGITRPFNRFFLKKRKGVTFTSALLAQNSTDPLWSEKDLHSRKLWKDTCWGSCGAAWQVLSTWLSQILLWVSWFCSLCFLSVNPNSWNQWSLWILLLFDVARICWWEFLRSEGSTMLIFSTFLQLSSLTYTFLLKMYCFYSKQLQNSCSVSLLIVKYFYKNKNIGGIHFIFSTAFATNC